MYHKRTMQHTRTRANSTQCISRVDANHSSYSHRLNLHNHIVWEVERCRQGGPLLLQLGQFRERCCGIDGTVDFRYGGIPFSIRRVLQKYVCDCNASQCINNQVYQTRSQPVELHVGCMCRPYPHTHTHIHTHTCTHTHTQHDTTHTHTQHETTHHSIRVIASSP